MKRDYPDRPIVGVIAVIQRNAAFLLVRRAKAPDQGRWGFPGGVLELGETVFEAAARELHEETGVAGVGPRFLTSLDVIEHDTAGRVARHYTLIAVAMTSASGEASAADDADAVGWYRLEDLETLPVLPAVGRIMMEALDI
jgi:ADP-ribose pyrophosphatase YjhB (NUDIX family)